MEIRTVCMYTSNASECASVSVRVLLPSLALSLAFCLSLFCWESTIPSAVFNKMLAGQATTQGRGARRRHVISVNCEHSSAEGKKTHTHAPGMKMLEMERIDRNATRMPQIHRNELDEEVLQFIYKNALSRFAVSCLSSIGEGLLTSQVAPPHFPLKTHLLLPYAQE